MKNGIHETTEYLELFLRNLLLDEENELHNRAMHIGGVFDETKKVDIQSANSEVLKCQNGTLELSFEELAILKILKTEPTATQKRIAELAGKSERTIKRRTVEMQVKGLICRENGKRNGRWKILVEI